MTHHRSPPVAQRQWAVTRIREWLRSSAPVLLVTGVAGSGKTTLATGLSRRDATVYAAHRCHGHAPSSTDPIRILANLADQLARTVPGYATLVRPLTRDEDAARSAAAHMVLDCATPSRAFDRALCSPLKVLASNGRLADDVLVVVDGIDEGSLRDGLALVELVAAAESSLPPKLRLLLTARPGLLTDRLREATRLDLTTDCPADDDGMADYLAVASRLDTAQRRTVAAAADGSWAYADLIARMTRTDPRFHLPDSPPAGLGGLHQWLLTEPATLAPLGRRVLSLLACSHDPGLTVNQVAAVLGATRQEVQEIVVRWSDLLSGTRWLRPYHRCLTEDLRAMAAGDGDAAEPDWLLADWLLRRWTGRWRACDQPYGLRHLLTHLTDVAVRSCDAWRRRTATAAIRQTVADPQFLLTALARVGVDDVLGTLRYVQDRLPTMIGRVAVTVEVLRRQAGALRQVQRAGDPALAAQQLMFEAATFGADELGRALADHVSSGVSTLWATIDSPMRFAPTAHPGHAATVTDVAITPDGTQAATCAQDGTTRLWRLASGLTTNEVPTGVDVTNVFITPDATGLVTNHRDGMVDAWDTATGEQITKMSGPGKAVSAFAVDQDGARGISGDIDGNATVWDLSQRKPVRRLPGLAMLLTAIAISMDGLVAAGSFTSEVVIWETSTGRIRHRFSHPERVSALALTPAGDQVVIGTDGSLTARSIAGDRLAEPFARLLVRSRVTAAEINPAMPQYVLFGTAFGQVAYVSLAA